MCKSSELFVDIDKVVTIGFDSVSLFDFSSGFVMVGSTFCSSFWSCKKSLYFVLSEPIKLFYSNWIKFFQNKNSTDRVQVKVSINRQSLLYYLVSRLTLKPCSSDIFLSIKWQNSTSHHDNSKRNVTHVTLVSVWGPWGGPALFSGIVILIENGNSPALSAS